MEARHIILLAIFLFATACGNSLHVIYLDKDRKVRSGDAYCERSYGTWDGKTWIDFYSAPCNVFIERDGKK